MWRLEVRRLSHTGLLFAVLLLGAGCAGSSGPPPIAIGTPCAACGMGIQDLRFACEQQALSGWRAYDAIECLVREAGSAVAPMADPGEAWLADYDTRVLLAADSIWVVQGAFASPMGGGFAAFRRRGAADSIAAATSGHVDRLDAFIAEAAGSGR